MKSIILTILFLLTVCTVLSAQENKDSLEFYRLDFSFSDRRISNNQIYDTGCYQVQYITPKGFIYTDSIVHCDGKKYRIYFPIRYTSKVETIKVDTSEILNIYDGLHQFNEPIIWNSNEYNNSIRISVFKDTIPVIFRIDMFEGDYRVTKKTGNLGHWLWDKDWGYTEKQIKVNPHRINRIKNNIEEIIVEYKNEYIDFKNEYKNDVLGKNILIEMNSNKKYEYILTVDLLLYTLDQSRKFKKVMKLLK